MAYDPFEVPKDHVKEMRAQREAAETPVPTEGVPETKTTAMVAAPPQYTHSVVLHVEVVFHVRVENKV